MSFPLKAKLDNGATVSDWLGTAMTAAVVAAKRIEAVREGSTRPNAALADAVENLTQALNEIQAVQAQVIAIPGWTLDYPAEADKAVEPDYGAARKALGRDATWSQVHAYVHRRMEG